MFVQYHFDSYRKSFKARNQLNFESDSNYIHLKNLVCFVMHVRLVYDLNVLKALKFLTYKIDLLHTALHLTKHLLYEYFF